MHDRPSLHLPSPRVPRRSLGRNVWPYRVFCSLTTTNSTFSCCIGMLVYIVCWFFKIGDPYFPYVSTRVAAMNRRCRKKILALRRSNFAGALLAPSLHILYFFFLACSHCLCCHYRTCCCWAIAGGLEGFHE